MRKWKIYIRPRWKEVANVLTKLVLNSRALASKFKKRLDNLELVRIID